MLDYDYFGDPGSTISVSTWTNKSGDTFLRQTAYGYRGEFLIAASINLFGAQEPVWQAQAENLARLIDEGN